MVPPQWIGGQRINEGVNASDPSMTIGFAGYCSDDERVSEWRHVSIVSMGTGGAQCVVNSDSIHDDSFNADRSAHGTRLNSYETPH